MQYAQRAMRKFILVMKNDKLNLWRAVYAERCKYGFRREYGTVEVGDRLCLPHEIDNDVQRLKLLKASYDSQRYSLQDNFMIRFPKLIKAAEEKLVCVREDLKARDAALLTSAEFAITVGNVTFT